MISLEGFLRPPYIRPIAAMFSRTGKLNIPRGDQSAVVPKNGTELLGRPWRCEQQPAFDRKLRVRRTEHERAVNRELSRNEHTDGCTKRGPDLHREKLQ